MAYWLYCTACGNWSKSATPLSDDKTCSHCHNLFITEEPGINPVLDNIVIEKLKEWHITRTTTIAEEDDRPGIPGSSKASKSESGGEKTAAPETAESFEIPVNAEIFQTPEDEEAPAPSEAEVEETEEMEDKIPEAEAAESAETQEEWEISAPIETKAEETAEMEDKIPEAEAGESAETPEEQETTGPSEAEAEETAEMEDIIPEAGAGESAETPEERETPAASEAEVEEITETSETQYKSPLQETSQHKPTSTPAHRIFFENRRRMNQSR